MSKLPLLSAKELTKVLKRLGFEFKRQQGSHMFFEHPNGRTTVIPNHSGEDIDRGLLNSVHGASQTQINNIHSGEDIDRGLLNKIIKHDLQITREEFLNNL